MDGEDDEKTGDIDSFVRRPNEANSTTSATTTREDLEDVFKDIFPDVNYGEVSAKYRRNMSDVLLRICVSLLISEDAVGDDQVSREDLIAMSKDARENSFLPGGRPVEEGSILSASVRSDKGTTPLGGTLRHRDSPPPPVVVEHKKEEPQSNNNGSWRNTNVVSAFSFDKPPLLSSSSFPGIFSPQERETKVFDSKSDSDAEPPAVDNTETNRDTRSSPATESPTTTKSMSRKEREKAEMDALLGKAKKNAPADQPAKTAVPRKTVDLDEAEGTRKETTGARPFRSVLDDEEDRRRRENPEPTEPSDEDGVHLQDHIQNMYAKIEHNAALDKQATEKNDYLLNKYKPAKKNEKAPKVKLDKHGNPKKESKCKC
ncbi:ras-like small GTPase [Angomonas deanei]|nr:ras-like small GTPase [Angomonas deanei]|eukprot:EPY16757.1 ras-like small GTPase [Angomonas deanei]